jgi:hypothetical protein
MSRALNCSDLAFAPVDTFGVAACVACRTDLGFSTRSEHSFAVSGEDNALTFGTSPFAEHSQIRTTLLEGGRGLRGRPLRPACSNEWPYIEPD